MLGRSAGFVSWGLLSSALGNGWGSSSARFENMVHYECDVPDKFTTVVALSRAVVAATVQCVENGVLDALNRDFNT